MTLDRPLPNKSKSKGVFPMTASPHDISRSGPRTGPWIIGYAVSFALVSAVAAGGYITSAREAAPFWIPIIICTVMIVYTSWQRHRALGTYSRAARLFWRRFVGSAGLMFVSYCVLAYGQSAGWGASAQRVFMTLPMVGFAGMVWAVHYYPLEETDEYLRNQSLRQIAIASFVALIGALVWSAIASSGVGTSGSLGYIVLLWFGGLGIGRLVNEMRP